MRKETLTNVRNLDDCSFLVFGYKQDWKQGGNNSSFLKRLTTENVLVHKKVKFTITFLVSSYVYLILHNSHLKLSNDSSPTVDLY